MSFEATEFLKSTDLKSDFERLKKDELLLLAEHLEVPVTSRMKKIEIKTMVAEKLIQQKYLSYEKYPYEHLPSKVGHSFGVDVSPYLHHLSVFCSHFNGT